MGKNTIRESASAQSPGISRRKLLTVLGLGALSATVPLKANSRQKRALHLQDTRIAGSHYYHFPAVAEGIQKGDALSLTRQRGNSYDKRAVEVHWRHSKIGYLPRYDNAAVASLIDRGHKVQAQVLSVLDKEEAWEPLEIRLWLDQGNRKSIFL